MGSLWIPTNMYTLIQSEYIDMQNKLQLYGTTSQLMWNLLSQASWLFDSRHCGDASVV